MSTPQYSMVTVATCESGFLNEALGHVGTVCDELKADAGALATRYGVISTGDHIGQIVLIQGYADLGGIDSAFGVYAASDSYQALISSGKIGVTLRNIMKVEDIGLTNPSSDTPAYGVLTRWGSADPMVERAAPMVPVFEAGGAMFLRYYSILTGSNVGRRLLAVGYPSMDAIEKTYAGLMDSPEYHAFVADVDLDFRNIVRVVG